MTLSETDRAIIEGYRRMIEARYEENRVRALYDIPASFSSEKLIELKSYFLDYIYPPVDRRALLNEAFDQLDNHTKQPEHLLRILLDSGSLIFKYGRHLPGILRAGLKALKSFRKASLFERHLADKARLMELVPPFTTHDMEALIASLDRREIDQFIASSLALFETLYDRKLVRKILAIVDHLIEKMKKRPKVYSPEEVEGLYLGKEIISRGDQLFGQLTSKEQEKLFSTVVQIERDAIDRIFEKA